MEGREEEGGETEKEEERWRNSKGGRESWRDTGEGERRTQGEIKREKGKVVVASDVLNWWCGKIVMC